MLQYFGDILFCSQFLNPISHTVTNMECNKTTRIAVKCYQYYQLLVQFYVYSYTCRLINSGFLINPHVLPYVLSYSSMFQYEQLAQLSLLNYNISTLNCLKVLT